ncbi:Fpg/Nei family DNA glycosylase [Corynebacterium uberis]|uniref:Fpg/Nei family DNA glycosylase n=1 Tax=Corynebacterium TaxID=1716 RepID=UPI001D0B05D9|nr:MULTISPECIES: DNA-formamidopyrimidine glycosylase family protein [Corynebacterium]MCZ9310321.1 Fpg/Nei family DNA glycosylase [Corynebacterium sp. c6VSa_13]UDL73349.1 Fpg/Nei family DNA glycosylase [Corynebacterium uberis]UDL75773.1 Fpg/Nei family DNA glycosylase [Corynebacterium uberis]UDL77985.1 Fpg/Nei family DNA glycosylase [Corynebacterium uberis]UDL80268.1 Fpg/Nei family DNA glycosylase [Corynebacterium uberis]
MPEGHVIHRLAHALTSTFGGHPVTVTSPQGRFSAEAATLSDHTLEKAEAWGKHLFLTFDSAAPEHVVHIHLGLIGKLRLHPLAPPRGAVRMRITDGTTAADLHGPQWCRLITEEDMDGVIARQGADPLRADAAPAATLARTVASRKHIGALLMDQHLYAGVGNIYRAEALFRAGISPFQQGNQLTDAEARALWDDLVDLMAVGVERGRIDTVRPEHTPEAMGRPERIDDHGGEVYVYRRAGAPCLICGTPVRQQTMEGRNLFWCPRCQRLKKRVERRARKA